MLRSNAKHRRPSKAVRYATLAGVTGAAVAVPLLGATSASAATASQWDQVAQCESGGNWSINTGNGFFGGLQFTSSTWAAYGGTAFAPEANQASPSPSRYRSPRRSSPVRARAPGRSAVST